MLPTFHKLFIKSITKETPEAVSIQFEIPSHLQNDFAFIAGQYLMIQWYNGEKTVYRAYSIAASPYANEIQITVKSVSEGDFSHFANTSLHVGDFLEVSLPQGNFTLQTVMGQSKNYLALATGSGITPIYAMIQAVLESEPQSRFGLIYGNTHPDHTIFKSQLDALQIKYPERFSVQYLYSRFEDNTWETGRIDSVQIERLLQSKFKVQDWDACYICGQEAFKEESVETLIRSGFPSKKLHYEIFGKPRKVSL
jgi:ring-1,2-phenylacetyl-CoA epoxidase subunit PaaE